MHESWRFVCLLLNCGDCEEVSEKHIMAAHLVELLQISNSWPLGLTNVSETQQLVEAVSL